MKKKERKKGRKKERKKERKINFCRRQDWTKRRASRAAARGAEVSL
jgi:hypothetical protein